MNKQLKIVREQCDRFIVAWKTLDPDALPPTPSHIDDEQDGSDEEDEVAPTNGDE